MQNTEREVLLIDAGNTRVKGAIGKNGEVISVFSMDTEAVVKDVGTVLKFVHGDVAVASVVPEVSEKLREALPDAFFVSGNVRLPFKLSYRGMLGADRLASMAGGCVYSKSFIVVSCGTATVIDVVVDGEFQGGFIFPGVASMASCLSEKTFLLPEVNVGSLSIEPGKSTEECMVSGLTVSTVGAVEFVRRQFNLPVFVTGGFGEQVRRFLEGDVRLVKTLTFEGIYEIWRLNSFS